MAVLTGWIFLQLGGSLSRICSREGAVYTAAYLQGYLILLLEAYRLTIDIQLFDREYGEGVISAPSFLVSRRLARIFVEDVHVSLIFSVIYYVMIGFRPLASQNFVFFSIILLSQYIAVNLQWCALVSRGTSLVPLSLPIWVSNWIIRPIIALLVFTIAFFLGSGLLFRFRKAGLGISRAQRTIPTILPVKRR